MSRASKTDTNALKAGKKIFRPSENPGDAIPSSLLPFCYFHTENRITKFCQCSIRSPIQPSAPSRCAGSASPSTWKSTPRTIRGPTSRTI